MGSMFPPEILTLLPIPLTNFNRICNAKQPDHFHDLAVFIITLLLFIIRRFRLQLHQRQLLCLQGLQPDNHPGR